MLRCFFSFLFFFNSEYTNSSETHLILVKVEIWSIFPTVVYLYLFFISREHIVHFVEIEYGAWDDKVLNVPNVNYWFTKNATNSSELGAMLEQLLNSWNTTMKNLLIGKMRVHALKKYDQFALNNARSFWNIG